MNAARVGHLAVALALGALTVGCSSGDDVLSLPTTESSIATSSQSPRTTESVTTTETSTTTPDTKPDLEIPTEWESDLDEIFGRYLLFWEAEEIALGPPTADPDYSPLPGLLGEEALAEVVDRAERYRDDAVVLVVPEDSIGQHILRLPNPAVLAKEDGRKVIIQDCWIQDDEKHGIDGGIVEATQESYLFNVGMRVIEDEWRVDSITPASEESSGYQECTDYLEYLDSSPPCPQCWPYGQE